MTAQNTPENGWLIHKAGRGWYRPDAKGYTAHPHEAGRYSHADALSYSHPNGWDGPRDGITIKHESHVPGAFHRADLAAALAVPEVAALVEAARLCSEWDAWAASTGGVCPAHLVNSMDKLNAALAALKGGA